MELSKQVVSLELAKWLKELKVHQISTFVWVEDHSVRHVDTGQSAIRLYYKTDTAAFNNGGGSLTQQEFARLSKWSAFTVAELGEMLPNSLIYQERQAWFESMKNNGGNWMVAYDNGDDAVAQHADTEADARAKMLIYLIENGLNDTPTPHEK